MTFGTIYFACTHCNERFVLFPKDVVSEEMLDREIATHVAACHPEVARPLTSVTTEDSNSGMYYHPKVAQ